MDSCQLDLSWARQVIQSQWSQSVASFLEELAAQCPASCAQGWGTLRWLLAKGLQPVANYKSVTWLCSLTSHFSSFSLWLWGNTIAGATEGLLPLIYLPFMGCNCFLDCTVKMAHLCFNGFLVSGSGQGTQIRTRVWFSPLGSINKLGMNSWARYFNCLGLSVLNI